MADLDITPEAAEGYLAAVADHLETKGYTLPSALPYTFLEGEKLSGAITLLDAMLDGTDLGLVWDETKGWQAGHQGDGRVWFATELELDVAPPPWRVALSVARIVRKNDPAAGQPDGRIVHGAEELAAYEAGVLELVQAGAHAMHVHASLLGGRKAEPGYAATWQIDTARPIVAAVWNRVREDLAEVERLRARPTADDLTGLETRCALLHAATDTDPVVKEVAWKTFALIRAYRETKSERGRLAEQHEAAVQAWKDEHDALDRTTAELKAAEQLANRHAAAHDTALQAADEQRHNAGLAESEATELRRRLDHARQVAAQHHDPTGPETGECRLGCAGCAMEDALDGKRVPADELSGADVLLDHIQQCHPEVGGMAVAQSGSLNDEVAELERQGWTVERTEYVAGKRIRIMKPPTSTERTP